MNIILGATGQVGSAIVNQLIKNNEPVRGVIRNPDKADLLKEKGTEVAIADFFDPKALKRAVQDGERVFLLTPETRTSDDVLGDTRTLLTHYRQAVEASAVKEIVGLSSIGAQHASGTGNLQMSYMLEHAFTDLSMAQVYVRPAYYYSNWLLYLSVAKEQGILPTFFPADLKIPMVSPEDVAAFIAKKMTGGLSQPGVYELVGPNTYSSADVAAAFSQVLGQDVKAQPIPEEQWGDMLQQAGFTEDAAQKLMAMTRAVIDGRAVPEGKGENPLTLQTTLTEYLEAHC